MFGLDVRIARAAAPALGKLAGGSASALGKSGLERIKTTRANRRVRARIAAQGNLDELVLREYSSGTAEKLTLYLESPDFANIALGLSVQILAGETDKKQAAAIEALHDELESSLRLVLDLRPTALRRLAGGVFDSLSGTIADQSSLLLNAGGLTTESRALIVRTAAKTAAASVRNAAALDSVESLNGYRDFERHLKDQAKTLHSSMRLPHAETTRKISYGRLFVEPGLTTINPAGASHGHGRNASEAQALPLDRHLQTSLRAVILGDPGGGKSTLSLKLAYDIARGAQKSVSATVPLLVVLRDYATVFDSQRARPQPTK